ncbi:MAG: glycosyltransferase family 4 protein [Imperialibacter sp.]|uniref:glycosyltransferase family 4 protein n=1 Tax=Imperialibacter sp. TaxID=2038411 RepID=UPI003A85E2F4
MNIFLLTYEGKMAGSTNSISFLALGLAKKGHNVYVGCRRESLLYALLENSGVNLVPMKFRGRFSLKDVLFLKQLIQQNNIHIINAQSSKDRYISIFTRWLMAKKVIVVHTRRQRPRSMGGSLQNWFYVKGTDKVVVVGDELKKVFIENGYPPSHLEVIYNGTPASQYDVVSSEKVEELRTRFGLRKGDRIVGCVSRMKAQPQLIQALALLPFDIRVVFAGIKPGSLDKWIEMHHIKNEVIYAGLLDRTEVLNLYKLFQVNVLASTMDGFGLVLVEAMALEVPVVATNAYGIKDVVKNEVNGLLFEDGDISGLARQILRTFNDDSLRNTLIQNGKITAFETFSIQKTITNYDAFFTALINDKQSR